MGAKLAKSAEAVRGPIKAARSSSRLRGLKGLGAAAAAGDADLDFDDGEDTFQDLTGKRRFASLYVLGARLGAGTYAEVYRCTHRRTHKERAVKVVMLDRLTHEDDLRALEEEIEILSTLQHKNIVRLHQVFREEGRVYLVQEIASGGELFDRIVSKRNYCENDARELMRRALQALAYAHGQGVVHRDLKPENILLASPDDDVELKLADFGMARCLTPKLDCLSTICGSPGYMAPEIITQQPYDEKVDIWSLGTILFCLLGGYNPWDDRSTAMVFAKIKRGKYRFDGAAFQAVTEDAKDLIKHMLVAAPEKRICAQAALHHKWFLVNESALMRVKLTLTQSELRDMRSNARFRRAANAVMVANRLKVLSSGRSLSSGSSLSTISSGGTSASASTISSASSASSLSRSGHTGSVSSLSSSSVGDSKHGSEDAASSKGNGDSLGRSGSARSRSSSATLEGGAAAAAAAYHGSSSNDHIHDGVMRRGPSAAGSGASRTSAPSSPVTVSAGRAAGDAAGAKAAADWAASCTPPGTRSGERVHGKTVSFGYDDRREEDDLDTRRHAGMAAAGEAEELKVDTTTWM